MATTSDKPVRRRPAAEEARNAIERAEADGVRREDMVLRMTLSDVAELKRDPKVATADISFVGGGMTYLGVKVEQGGVIRTALDRGDGAGTAAA
jgi:hypothetical protein